jgi:hypothetical protein
MIGKSKAAVRLLANPVQRFHNQQHLRRIIDDLECFSDHSWRQERFNTKKDAALAICHAEHPALVFTRLSDELCVAVRVVGPYMPTTYIKD